MYHVFYKGLRITSEPITLEMVGVICNKKVLSVSELEAKGFKIIKVSTNTGVDL